MQTRFLRAEPSPHLDELVLRLGQPSVAVVDPGLPVVELRLARQDALRLLLAIEKRSLTFVEPRGAGREPRGAVVQLRSGVVQLGALLLDCPLVERKLTDMLLRGAQIALAV